jgi:nicotinate-nucleotide adenylyltransferase
MKIAILGGSFDPPHRGHIIIAKRLLKLNYFDQIWLMPLFRHPFNKLRTDSVRDKNLSSPHDRLEMTKCLENDEIKVSDFETRKKTISYSIDTLKFLSKNNPKNKYFWIIGTDQVEGFTKWKNWKEIINNFKLIIFPRAGFKKAEKELKNIAKQVVANKNIILLNRKKFPPIYISSTLTRRKIKEGKSLRYVLPKKVEEYIIKNKLYQ